MRRGRVVRCRRKKADRAPWPNLLVPWGLRFQADSGYAPAKESLKEFERRGFTLADTAAVSNSAHDTKASKSSSTNLQLTFLNFSPDTVKHTPDSLLVEDVMKAASI